MENTGKIVPSCQKCICYTKDELAAGGLLNKQNQGTCHRYPPQIVSVTAKTLEGVGLVPGAMFPQVGADWWCGEFRPRPNPQSPPDTGVKKPS